MSDLDDLKSRLADLEINLSYHMAKLEGRLGHLESRTPAGIAKRCKEAEDAQHEKL